MYRKARGCENGQSTENVKLMRTRLVDRGVRIISTFYVLRHLYFVHFTSARILRPFCKSGLLICPEVQVEVKILQADQTKV